MTEGGTVVEKSGESDELNSRSTCLGLGETHEMYSIDRLTSLSLSLPIYKLGDIHAHMS